MSMLVAPFMVTFADAVVRVTGDDSVTIGDVAKGDFSICIAHTNIPLTPSPTKNHRRSCCTPVTLKADKMRRPGV